MTPSATPSTAGPGATEPTGAAGPPPPGTSAAPTGARDAAAADDAAPDFPVQRGCPFAPPAEYAALRRAPGLTRVRVHGGKPAWLVSRYADVRTALAHPGASSDARHPAFPALGAGEQQVAAELRPFIRMDAPEHTAIRKMLVGEFTLRRVRALRPEIERICEDQAEHLLSLPRPADLVAEYANRVSTTVICRLLGVPMEDLAFFRRVTSVSGSRSATAEEVGAALHELFGMLDRLIDVKAEAPEDDLISRLVHGPLARGEITRTSLLSQLGITLNAGHETSRNLIPLAALDLLRSPDQLALLREDPGRWPAAAEELMRHLSVADAITLRVALRDIELDDGVIPAGDGFIALLGAANHDPGAFPDPGRLDVLRTRNAHVAFGHGAHQCVGQGLGRAEVEIALRVLFDRVPSLALAVPEGDLPMRGASAIFGLEEVPVTW